MFSRLWKLMVSSAAVTAVYYLYALVVVPLIEPPVRTREPLIPPASVSAQEFRAAQLQPLFPKGSWELDNPKVLETDEGRLLLKDYQPHADGRLELKPCTIILGGTDETSSSRPVVLQAPEGAELKFDGTLDLTRGQIGRLQGGRLIGPVTIRSPESRPGAADDIELHTRDIVMTREQVRTPHPVTFRHGRSQGSGKDLRITLDAAEMPDAEAGGKMKLSLGALRSLELVRVDNIHLDLESAHELKPPHGKPNGRKQPTTMLLDITCQGPFRYDFATHTATFEDRVEVVHSPPDGPRDQLRCQMLLLEFIAPGTDADKAGAGKATSAADLRGFRVAQIEARGTPAVLRAPSYTALAQAAVLAFDFQNKRVRMEDPQRTTLRYGDYEFETREVAYQFAADNRLGQLRALGGGFARGPMSSVPGQTFEARWSERLIVQPDQGAHAVSLMSQAEVRCVGLGQFTADSLHLWLQEVVEPPKTAKEKPRVNYQPERMLAERNVRLDSWQLKGTMERAEIWIRHEAAPAAGDGLAGRESPQPKSSALTAQSRPQQVLDIHGRRLQAQLVRHGSEQPEVEHLVMEGAVNATAVPLDRPQELPFRLKGDSVQIDAANQPTAHARVRGTPAMISARGMTLIGNDLQLDRAANRLWNEGPGRVTLPANVGRAAGGNPATTPRDNTAPPLQVAWQTRLVFDGKTAKFLGGVQARGQQMSKAGDLFDLSIDGEELHATLSERVDFARDQQASDIEVRELNFRGPARLQNRGSRRGQPVSFDQLQVRDLSLEQGSGRLHAYGPGWGSSVRLKESGAAAVPGGEKPPAGAAKDSRGLIFVRVDYEDEIVGNVGPRDVEFRGRVRTVYGPVAAWDQTLDPDPRDGIADGQMLLTSDQLSLAEVGPRGPQDEPPIELAATGNATIEGKEFTARARRIAYARAKQLLILEGDGRNDAELWRRGSTTPDAAAQQIRFWTNDYRVDMSGGRFLQLTNPKP